MADNDNLTNNLERSSLPYFDRGVLSLHDLNNMRLRKLIPFQYALHELNQGVVISVTADGYLEAGLLSNIDYKKLNRKIKPIGNRYVDRPRIRTSFDVIDDEIRRKSFNVPRLLDYMGCDKTEIRKIALSKELSYPRANYYIDEIDDSISLYLNKKLYSMYVEKRPRIDLKDYFKLIKILPNRLFHLVNIIGTGNSLILHRRSQRTANFKTNSPLSRMERLFYWCANIKDGHYEFPFIEEDFKTFMKSKRFQDLFPLDKTKEDLLNDAIKASVILIQSAESNQGCNISAEEFQFLSTVPSISPYLIQEGHNYFYQNFHSELKLQLPVDEQVYWLNEIDRKRFMTYKPTKTSQPEIPMPGHKKQKTFLMERFNSIKTLSYNQIMTQFPELIELSQLVTPTSLGRLSKEGRKSVKLNLNELYKYYRYIYQKHLQSPDIIYWITELNFVNNSLIVNILLWQTNCLRTIVVK